MTTTSSPGRVLLGWPVGNSEMPCFTSSVRGLMLYEGMKGDEPLLANVVVAPGLYVDDNRNCLVEQLLKMPPRVEWLLQIDTDIEFKPYILELMLTLAEERGYRILGASVPIGETNETSAFLFGDAPGRMNVVLKMPPIPIRVDAVATTCTLIHRSVFVDMAEKFGPSWFTRMSVPDPDHPPESKRDFVFGEDIAFCVRARSMGIEIWCAHIPGLRHWKLVGFTHDDPSEWPQREKKGERSVWPLRQLAGLAEG